MNNARYGKLTAGLIAAWFVFALSASALHLFKTDPSLPPLPLGLAVVIPVAAFLIWFATSSGFREFALSLNPRTLTYVHSWRIAGFTFLALYAAGLLPRHFRTACRPGRHRHRSNCALGGQQACELQPAQRLLCSGRSWGLPTW